MFSVRPLAQAAWWLVPLVLALTVSVSFLAVRNIYDDELGSFEWIVRPAAEAWSGANATDVHPPGMYVAGGFAYRLTGSPRWMTVVPLAVWFLGLTLFVVATRPLWPSAWTAWLFASICYLHPQALMWMNSIRWYPWWSGIALTVITFGLLRPQVSGAGRSPRLPSYVLCGLLGVLSGLMFYFNYLAVLFYACFGLAWLVRYGIRSRSLARLSIVAIVTLIVCLPQLKPFFSVHMAHRGGQLFSFARSALELTYGLSIGKAILPWHPVTVLVLVGFIAPNAVLFLLFLLRPRDERAAIIRRSVTPLLVLFLGMAIVGIVTGLGGKSRSFTVLTPLVAVFLALGAAQLSSHRAWRLLNTGLAAIWIATSVVHLVTHTGTAKNGLNDNVDEVVARVFQLADHRPSLVITYDPALAHAFDERLAREPGRHMTVCSYYRDWICDVAPGLPPGAPQPDLVFYVETYGGSLLLRHAKELAKAEAATLAAIRDERVVKLGRDPDWRWKERVSGTELPEYRFIIHWGPAVPAKARRMGQVWTGW